MDEGLIDVRDCLFALLRLLSRGPHDQPRRRPYQAAPGAPQGSKKLTTGATEKDTHPHLPFDNLQRSQVLE